MKSSLRFFILLTGIACGVVACKKDKSESYTVSKAQGTAAADMQMQSNQKLEEDAGLFGIPSWSPPADWKAQPLGSMRKGSWAVSKDNQQAEVTVLAFPGDVGGDLANTNRWAQQIGLDAMSANEMDSISQFVKVDGYTARFITLLNEEIDEPLAMLVVVVPVDNGTWFFKCMGDAELVKAQRQPILAFLDTVHF